eukprot:4200485-Prymnesium_polylepis.2
MAPDYIGAPRHADYACRSLREGTRACRAVVEAWPLTCRGLLRAFQVCEGYGQGGGRFVNGAGAL